MEPADKDPNAFALQPTKDPLTQEEWVANCRKSRNNDFAPPSALYDSTKNNDSTNRNMNNDGSNNKYYEEEDRRQRELNRRNKRAKTGNKNQHIVNECEEEGRVEPQVGLSYAESSVFRDYVGTGNGQWGDAREIQEPRKQGTQEPKKHEPRNQGIEIAPPLTFEYNAPSTKDSNRRVGPSLASDKQLADAIAKGLKDIKNMM